MSAPAAPAPVPASERLDSLDTIRGLAVLGILLMNSIAFALPFAAYGNPLAFDPPTGLDWLVFALTELLADQKFLATFSMLYGAGICLMAARQQARGRRAFGLHLRRSWWLFLVGMVHAYGLWHGDILVTYAICGCLAFPLWRRSIRTLVIVGILWFSISSLLMSLGGLQLVNAPEQVLYEQGLTFPTAQETAQEIASYRSGWIEQMELRAYQAFSLQTDGLLFVLIWRATGLMLLGMALYKSGFLSALWTSHTYARLAVFSGIPGLALVASGLWLNEWHGWDYVFSFFLGEQPNYWGSVLMAIAYMSAVLWAQKQGLLSSLRKRLAAVGRMAFTNYLAQTVISTFVFYGHGLGLFATFSRTELLLYTLGVWTLQLILSPWWLDRFRFGPLEWLWRSLTYWKLQPFRLPA